ncbi:MULTISPECIES: DUF1501 domain-containing protein [unclassified Polaribacter]|uniref:DUF1501 domain-containing protein n=1 Tax=unclassified Polaribacter TaxID=196858 RepID=UPI0011BDCCE9|nr:MULTISPECIES: DUF1501 domain-containing protein [unclassified Polaribacter]TXD51140.1 DUF1501 domain-containing protein [Polaribacter sp. IC063]TXD56767.1 DUF1501 domain-containing protein [Polaribacter sp. IC066]
MNRKEFLKLATTATFGTPFLLNGLHTQALDNFVDLPITNMGINDRVLVIVRMAGANDGLNTIIPVKQYRDYVALRPNIHIKESGPNKFIPLDSTLPDNQLSGLHPVLTGFKGLYDAGKMGIINGVGYEAPNFSHFRSQDTMFAGKDGTSNNDLSSGMFGRYIGALHPGLANNPTAEKSDPLTLQFGTTNPCLFYGHDHEQGIEYNATSLQDDFNNQLARKSNNTSSEYQELLSFLTNTERAMDRYYNAIQRVFNAGSNSATPYPDTDLAKQLKTVARMIQGGSKTKIFQVTLGGFDTHANQVRTDASHLGSHKIRIGTVSNAIEAFQKDIEILGLADKMMTVTFSEFGRRVRENGNFGTDHGTLSPFFVFGSHVKAGVYGSHPLFTNTTDFQYSESERKYDYRQLFATLMQDWLGADDAIMQEAELSTFSTQEKKIPLILGSKNAYPDHLISGPASNCENSTIAAIKVKEDNGWSYYATEGTTDYVFAIEHTPAGIGANTADFEASITLEKLCDNPPNNVHQAQHAASGEGTFGLGLYWNVVFNNGTTNGWVNLRWFKDTALEASLNQVASNFKTSTESAQQSPILDLHTDSSIQLPTQLRPEGLKTTYTAFLDKNTGSYLETEYIQYNVVNDLDNTGGGRFIKVTNFNENSTSINGALSEGTIRYNKTTNKLQGFTGSVWEDFH